MYVIDGYNLLHALRKIPGELPKDFGRARARVIALLSQFAQRESTKVRIFFDGTPGRLDDGDLDYPGVKVVFCGPGRESADHAVREFVLNAMEPFKLKVVSSDLEVAKSCKLNGAKVISSQVMATLLGKLTPDRGEPARPEKPTRGMIGDLEQEMLNEIGDFEEFQRRIEQGD
ncbi:MAG: NYN domain-containing protein [Planctomycetes bacterium]|nr:NYN domain-containing protein [Planctomycetota bacterium]